jgi:hypothetical protein
MGAGPREEHHLDYYLDWPDAKGTCKASPINFARRPVTGGDHRSPIRLSRNSPDMIL